MKKQTTSAYVSFLNDRARKLNITSARKNRAYLDRLDPEAPVYLDYVFQTEGDEETPGYVLTIAHGVFADGTHVQFLFSMAPDDWADRVPDHTPLSARSANGRQLMTGGEPESQRRNNDEDAAMENPQVPEQEESQELHQNVIDNSLAQILEQARVPMAMLCKLAGLQPKQGRKGKGNGRI